MTTLVLFALPGLFLVLALLAGRFPGERAIERAQRALARPRPRLRRAADVRPVRRRPYATVPRGGRLVAAALACRPPPPHGSDPMQVRRANHFQGAIA